jgi:hypothetical protein
MHRRSLLPNPAAASITHIRPHGPGGAAAAAVGGDKHVKPVDPFLSCSSLDHGAAASVGAGPSAVQMSTSAAGTAGEGVGGRGGGEVSPRKMIRFDATPPTSLETVGEKVQQAEARAKWLKVTLHWLLHESELSLRAAIVLVCAACEKDKVGEEARLQSTVEALLHGESPSAAAAAASDDGSRVPTATPTTMGAVVHVIRQSAFVSLERFKSAVKCALELQLLQQQEGKAGVPLLPPSEGKREARQGLPTKVGKLVVKRRAVYVVFLSDAGGGSEAAAAVSHAVKSAGDLGRGGSPGQLPPWLVLETACVLLLPPAGAEQGSGGDDDKSTGRATGAAMAAANKRPRTDEPLSHHVKPDAMLSLNMFDAILRV